MGDRVRARTGERYVPLHGGIPTGLSASLAGRPDVASLQRATGGRLVYNIISGGGGAPQLWWGDKVQHDDRYARTSEFLDVLRGVWDGVPFDYDGQFFRTEGASLPPLLTGQPFPEVYFSGSSGAAVDAAGRHSDYYLSWLEPFDDLRTKFDGVRAHSGKSGRTPKFAVRIDIVARHTEEAAWAEIEKGWAFVDREAANRAAQGDSVGAARIKGRVPETITGYRDLEVQPTCGAGSASFVADRRSASWVVTSR